MKKILYFMTFMLSCTHAVVAYADNKIKVGPSGACVVDSSLNKQRFYYCGAQAKDCAGEKHNNNDYYVCNNGDEQEDECFINEGTTFTTVDGNTYCCHDGTATTMGRVSSGGCPDDGNITVGMLAGLTLGPSRACLVATEPNREFFYCGEQDRGCAGEKDLLMVDNRHWYYHGESFTRNGYTIYCHNGTTDKMGEFKLEPPTVTVAGDEKLGPSGACIVSSVLNKQRFYYCGAQAKDCAGEKHNNNDYYVCNNGDEQEDECFITHGNSFTTPAGKQYYCCGGTAYSMGTIQGAPCRTATVGQMAAQLVAGMMDIVDAFGTETSGTQYTSNIVFQPCPSGIRYGNNPKTGACIECAVGKYYNAKDEKNEYCSWATVLTKTDMMYGYGQTKNSNTRLRNQCWTMKDPIAYRLCVLSGGENPKQVIKTLTQTAGATASATANTVSVK